MSSTQSPLVAADKILQAKITLKDVVPPTPLQFNQQLSEKYGARIYLKREDLNIVRSYKIRGAFNKIASLSDQQRANGIFCASAGNHAQGVAYACFHQKIHGKIYMPTPTTSQKIDRVRMFGKEFVEVILIGDTFDDANSQAVKDCEAAGGTFVPPFDDEKVIEGQGTVAVEILDEISEPIDYLLVPIGGGGLSAGVGSYFIALSPKTKIIGVEPLGAPAMKKSLEAGHVVTLEQIDKFVDGAAVQSVGKLNLEICKEVLNEVVLVPEGKVCTTLLELYNNEGIIVEPAGALTTAALDLVAHQIKGKTVVAIVSGGNNDIIRMAEIKERSMLYEGLRHYFIVKFPQRAGALKEFLVNVLGPNDDIILFEYTKKTARENGPAMIGIELKDRNDFQSLLDRMKAYNINYQLLNNKPELFGMLV
ncbi:MAG: threonine ammonia-lyase [Imperialibacter sp.]|uniref:threonine ammonia-lyase n=1 Tax=Imperialibacter sp. TaxID=2038411 RepID=UPI0032EEA242